MLQSCRYCWTIAQIEYSTDILFTSRDDIRPLQAVLDGNNQPPPRVQEP
jgi:hypothetical protein